MNTISDYILHSHDKIEGRESIEWANFWYSSSDITSNNDTRVLLVGDSTARMVRSTFERFSHNPVDMIGTSCGLHDVLFLSQMDAFFASSRYKYTAIFIQMGHHSIRGDEGYIYGDDDYKRFKEDYLGLVRYLRQYCTNIILLTCFLNVTPLPSKMKGLIKSIPVLLYRKIFGEKIDYSWSNVVIEKNRLIHEIALEEKLKFCDIDAIMRNMCQGLFPRFIHKDHIHYEPRAKKIIVSEYVKYL